MNLGAALVALTIGLIAPASDVGIQPAALRDIPRREDVVPSTANHVYYHGGVVLHGNRTHLLFWQPRGSGLHFEPGYMSIVERFLRYVAAASHTTSNVFGLTGQYTDYTGRPAAYASHYAGAVVDRHRLPANGCTEPTTGPPWTHCLTDSQLQAELKRVVRLHRLPHGRDDIYFLLMPRGLASCMSSNQASGCTLAGPKDGYCGYHGVSGDGLVRYAVIPYNAVPGHCQSNNPRPNRSPADPGINTMSHELAETITDPDGDAWYDNSGAEIADICLTSYGRTLGGSGVGRYNEIINGGHYYLQELWSNADHGCRPRPHPDRVSFSVVSRAGRKVHFRATANDPEGLIRSYHWSFGDGATGRGRNSAHRYNHSGSYHVRLRVVDSWGNYAYAVATVRIRRRPG